MTRRLLWALMTLILLAGCGSAAHPIVIETPATSATPYVTAEPTTRPTHTPAPTRTPRTAPARSTALPLGKININTADAEALMRLPHIGQVLAQRIIAYRREHGPFKRIEEIAEVKGIGDAIFAAIKDAITID